MPCSVVHDGVSNPDQQGAGERFRLVEQIGDGQWTTVYLAEDAEVDRLVALKVLRNAADEPARRRLVREAEALRRVDHPNILRILDDGVAPNIGHYLATEYHHGRTLAALIVERGRLPEAWVGKVMVQLLAALEAVHRAGGVHGDVTPANCLCVGFVSFDEDPVLCLLDFGASRWEVESGTDRVLFGTPVYMSPEQARGVAATPASDIYAAGIIAYEMLLGVPPFRASTSTEVLWQQVHEVPRRLQEVTRGDSTSRAIERAVLRALEKDPAARFRSAEEFAASFVVEDPERRSAGDDTARRTDTVDAAAHLLLARVRQDWIEGVLNRTTDGVILVNQKMWRADALVVDPTSSQREDLDVGLAEAFERCGGCLLLLGDVGHGKTVNLLRLARLLADRAIDSRGNVLRIPVVLMLSTWTSRHVDLLSWMTREVAAKYLIPHREVVRLFAERRIVPLLDGLDDLELARRTRCAVAINEHRRAHPRGPIVVTCRMNDYALLPIAVTMNGAVVLRALTSREIGRQLRAAAQFELLGALGKSNVLDELSRTPVLLHVMRVAFRDSKTFRGALTSHTGAVKELFEAFTTSVCRFRGDVRITLERVARLMVQTKRTMFLLEDAQPSWLLRARNQWLYAFASRGLVAMLFGASIILAMGLSPLDNGGFRTSIGFGVRLGTATALVLTLGFGGHAAWRLRRPSKGSPNALVRVVGALSAGLALGTFIGGIVYAFEHHRATFWLGVECGILGAVLFGLSRKNRGDVHADIDTIESIGWSWRHLKPARLVALVSISVAVLLLMRSIEGTAAAIHDTISVLIAGIGVLGYRSRPIHARITPNVGIHMTVRNGLLVATATFLVVSTLFGVTYGFGYGACVALTLATVMGLWLGGIDAINHYTLRFFLHRERSVDIRVTRPLDDAVELGLMRRVGSGYMFMHSMLLEYMAERGGDASA